jgi:hypothetical protein
LGAQNGTTQEPRLKVEPEPLLRRKCLGRLQQSQSQCWFAAVEAEHDGEKHAIQEAEWVSDALSQS